MCQVQIVKRHSFWQLLYIKENIFVYLLRFYFTIIIYVKVHACTTPCVGVVLLLCGYWGLDAGCCCLPARTSVPSGTSLGTATPPTLLLTSLSSCNWEGHSFLSAVLFIATHVPLSQLNTKHLNYCNLFTIKYFLGFLWKFSFQNETLVTSTHLW